MTVPRIFAAILMFGPGTAILPSRPVSAPPARAAKVKGGAAGAPWRALPLTGASTLAALHLSAAWQRFGSGRGSRWTC
jgi:hypothetical protein